MNNDGGVLRQFEVGLAVLAWTGKHDLLELKTSISTSRLRNQHHLSFSGENKHEKFGEVLSAARRSKARNEEDLAVHHGLAKGCVVR